MNTSKLLTTSFATLFALSLSACGGGGGGGGSSSLPPVSSSSSSSSVSTSSSSSSSSSVASSSSTSSAASSNSSAASLVAPVLTMELQRSKIFHFSWNSVTGATSYKLLESADGVSDFIQFGSDIAAATTFIDYVVPLHKRFNAKYKLMVCDASACVESNQVDVSGSLDTAIGYVKASNTDAGDYFGTAIAISSDGTTMAVGAPSEDGNRTGLNGDEITNSSTDSGAVYIYGRRGNEWVKQTYIKSINNQASAYFGASVALSSDGNTIAIGAPYENGPNNKTNCGAVHVFTRTNGKWVFQDELYASNKDALDYFGEHIALSGDGNTLAVGAVGESSSGTGVHTGITAEQSSNSASMSGAVYIYTRTADTWSEPVYVKPLVTDAGDLFGSSISISSDGNYLAVGAIGESSGLASNQANNNSSKSGAVYVFNKTSKSWAQQAYLKALIIGGRDQFGYGVALNGDGTTLAVGAPGEKSKFTGIHADPSDDSVPDAGAVYIFTRESGWTQQEYIKSLDTTSIDSQGDQFGSAVAISSSGDFLLVGDPGDDSNAKGLNGDFKNNSVDSTGSAYFLQRINGAWKNISYIKASNPGRYDAFGSAIAMDGSADLLAIGANENGSATGVNGDQTLTDAIDSGAVYLY